MLKTHKCSDISEWIAVTKLATLAHGSVLRIMENADENVGTLNPLDVCRSLSCFCFSFLRV